MLLTNKILQNKKILQISHNDLDGIGSYIVASYYLNISEIIFTSNNSKDEVILRGIKRVESGEFDVLLLTDISPSESLSYYQEALTNGCNIFIVDHHKTALKLASKNALIKIKNKDGVLNSATSLLYDFFIKSDCTENKNLEIISELIRRYDTWDWTILKDENANKLNSLFYIVGEKRMIKILKEKSLKLNIVSYIKEGIFFSPEEQLILNIEEERINRYVQNKIDNLKFNSFEDIYNFKNGEPLKMAYVSAERYTNDVAQAIYTKYDLDFVAVLGFNSVSLRTNKDNIDLSLIATGFGGGGHSKASGFSIPENLKTDLEKNIFKHLKA